MVHTIWLSNYNFQFFQVNGKCPCSWPADGATAVQFCPPGFALSSFITLPLVFPLPPASWFMVGPVFREVHLLSTDNSAWQVPGGRWPMRGMKGCHGYPLCLHFAYTRLLIACFAVNLHLPSIWNISYRQLNLIWVITSSLLANSSAPAYWNIINTRL